MLVLVLVAGGSAPLSLDIDQLLDSDRLDEHGPTARLHMPHRPGLDAPETGEGLGCQKCTHLKSLHAPLAALPCRDASAS